MQIREITEHSLREGFIGDLKNVGSALMPSRSMGAGFVQGLTGADFSRQPKDANLERATAGRAKELAQQWAQHIKTQQTPQLATAPVNEPAATAQPVQPTITRDQISQWISRNSQDPAALKAALDAINAQAEPGATNSNWRQDALKSAGVKFPQSESKQRSKSKTSNKNSNWRQDALKSVGAAFDPPPVPRPAPGQMPASVAASKQGKLMLQAYGKPRGGIQDIDEAPQEYTTPGGIVVPGGTRTDPKPVAMVDFERWADQQLTTQISGTGQKIDLDAVKKDPAIKVELDKVLPQIKKDPNNLAAVEQYFLTAMKGMQRMADAVKQKLAGNS